MTGLVRKATLLTAAGLLAASAAMAGVPSAANSTTPSCVPLVGSSAGVPDAFGTITVVVRDLANNPLSGASVVVDISGCTELALCDDQLDANALVVCASQTTRKFTDGLGSVSFIVLGGGSGPAATLLGGGKIFANGTLIASPTVNAYDENGIGGLGAADLSAFLGDFASGNPFGRSDFDCSGALGAADLSKWLTLFAGGTSTASCGSQCP
jgi:hypothetical protein